MEGNNDDEISSSFNHQPLPKDFDDSFRFIGSNLPFEESSVDVKIQESLSDDDKIFTLLNFSNQVPSSSLKSETDLPQIQADDFPQLFSFNDPVIQPKTLLDPSVYSNQYQLSLSFQSMIQDKIQQNAKLFMNNRFVFSFLYDNHNSLAAFKYLFSLKIQDQIHVVSQPKFLKILSKDNFPEAFVIQLLFLYLNQDNKMLAAEAIIRIFHKKIIISSMGRISAKILLPRFQQLIQYFSQTPYKNILMRITQIVSLFQ